MLVVQHMPFTAAVHTLCHELATRARPVGTKTWQGQDVADNAEMTTLELERVSIELGMVWGDEARQVIEPNLPWADDHFQERVSGVPMNPPPSAKTWPFARRGHSDVTDEGGQFSHTYPERFWPKHAGPAHSPTSCNMTTYDEGDNIYCDRGGHRGTRYFYGDLYDVVRLLKRDELSRQAFLPVWFPEDTGAVEGQRVPCTLGYHFMVRQSVLNVIYYMRACDMLRHFKDDVYLAMRLAEWVARETELKVSPGSLTMHISSLHIFAGDVATLDLMNHQYARKATEAYQRVWQGARR